MPRDDDMMPPNDDNNFNSDDDGEGDEAAAAGAPEGNEAPNNKNDAECPFFYAEDGDAMAFCCANCRCSPKRRAYYGDGASQAFEGDYWHRHCCHNVKKADSNWLPPLQELLEQIDEKQGDYEEAGLDYPVPNPLILTNGQPVRSNTPKCKTMMKWRILFPSFQRIRSTLRTNKSSRKWCKRVNRNLALPWSWMYSLVSVPLWWF